SDSFACAAFRRALRQRCADYPSQKEETGTAEGGSVPHVWTEYFGARDHFSYARRRSRAARAFDAGAGAAQCRTKFVRQTFRVCHEECLERVGRASGFGAGLRRLQRESHAAGAVVVCESEERHAAWRLRFVLERADVAAIEAQR